MRPASKISSKGQITVPIEVRHRLGVKEGDQIEFVFEGGRTIIRPARAEKNPFGRYVGSLPAFQSQEQINAWVSGLREEDARNGKNRDKRRKSARH
jgi:antitoxin PrlF